jgi:predicted secreted protein
MTLVTGIVLYIIIWWTVLFTMLPIGVRVPQNPEPGIATSAPEHPRILKKVIWTSLVSVVVWLLIYALIHSGLVSLGESGPSSSVY